ncbi:hypothetical protein GVO57_04630 [Sphingomonas changnyeongensis]|uniref:Glycosyltransferase RgtA/B/C/D-like domain-containing protein n=1 Tax=Sphingomonas changnyeongensis TaxID=2698679 RepID=A0A7Z2S832_9SPHN|nr:hypothetical protein GVO57_04630 [Sphingomonas changnyeongensis]
MVPLALGLAVALTALQVFLAWADLSARVLPMADDMLRLAGIRDWLAGQAAGDLTQLRLGPPGGTALDWSRLPDLVPALLVAALSPVTGPARAELVALVLWPELLFFAHMLIAAALARTLAGPRAALIAVVLAALATPAAAAFRPGAIGGLGMGIVAVEAAMLALVRGRFGAAGLLAALALAIGPEATPPLLAALVALIGIWAADRPAVTGGALLRGGAGLAAGAVADAVLLPQGGSCPGFAVGGSGRRAWPGWRWSRSACSPRVWPIRAGGWARRRRSPCSHGR